MPQPGKGQIMLPRILLACGIAAAGAFALAADAPPATQPAPKEVQAAREAVAAAVAAVAGDLGDESFQKREAAQKALRELSESVLAEVLARTDLDRPEQAQRVARLFSGVAASAHQGEMLIALLPKQRQAVLELARGEPESFNRLFSADPAEAAPAVTALVARGRPGSETVLLWAVRRPHWRVRLAAINAVGGLDGPSRKVNDALWERVEALGGGDGPSLPFVTLDEARASWTEKAIAQQERKAAMEALVSLKDDRVLGYLLKALVGPGSDHGPFGVRDEVLQLILSLDDKRTIVTLADHIGDNRQVTSIHYGGGDKITIKVGDLALGVILNQTQQDPADYGFYNKRDWPVDPGQMGFQTEQKRRAARAKFQKWWAEHRKDYAGVQKIPLDATTRPGDDGGRPDLPAFLRGLME